MNLIDMETGEVVGESTPLDLILASEQFRFTPTGLLVSGEPDFETWEQVGQQLSYIEGAVHWWIGDWLNYGEGRWGEMYSQALEATGFKYQTLANDKWVAGKIDFSVRTEKLDFRKYEVIAGLDDPEARHRWINIAAEENLTHRELRRRIKRNPSGIEALPDTPVTLPDSVTLIHGDIADIAHTLDPESVDVIITDPPYHRESVHLYEGLAELAARVLKPGGCLLAMCGQSYLPDIIDLMKPYLAYHWTISYQTPGGQSPQIWPRKINTFWKPVLWFVKGEYAGDWHGDVIKSDVNDNDKRFHEWGQSESGMIRLVENFSEEGDLILDPFLGGGTTGVVATMLNRRFIGIDIDQTSIEISKLRLNQITEREQV